jgi:hypothetical protein
MTPAVPQGESQIAQHLVDCDGEFEIIVVALRADGGAEAAHFPGAEVAAGLQLLQHAPQGDGQAPSASADRFGLVQLFHLIFLSSANEASKNRRSGEFAKFIFSYNRGNGCALLVR